VVTDKGIVPVKGGQYKLLSEDQVKDLHSATIEVLNDVGIKIIHEEALELMAANGCQVDFDARVVRIPEDVLLKFVQMAPSEIRLCGRDPKYDVLLSDSDDVYVMGGAGASEKVADLALGMLKNRQSAPAQP